MSIQGKVEFHGDEARVEIEARTWKGIVRASVSLWKALQKVLNVSNPRPYLNSSKPGEAPRKRTGWGQANVIYQLDEADLRAEVGVTQNAKYMAEFELGTHRSGKRPWLLVTVEKMLARLGKLVESD